MLKTPTEAVHKALGCSNKIWCPYADDVKILEEFQQEQKERTLAPWRRANEAKRLRKLQANIRPQLYCHIRPLLGPLIQHQFCPYHLGISSPTSISSAVSLAPTSVSSPLGLAPRPSRAVATVPSSRVYIQPLNRVPTTWPTPPVTWASCPAAINFGLRALQLFGPRAQLLGPQPQPSSSNQETEK